MDEKNMKRSFIVAIIVVALASSGIGAAVGVSIKGNNSQNVAGVSTKKGETSNVNSSVVSTNYNPADSPAIMIASKVGPAVVGISNKAQTYYSSRVVEQGSGSGVIIDSKNGYIVTNNHVVAGASQLEVSLSDGRHVSAKLIGTDPSTDLAVLKIEAKNLTAAALGDSDKLKVGEMVVAIGNPMGEEFAGSLTQGVVSALNRTVPIEDQDYKVIQTDAAINPGNSGGALVNSKGEVIGINSGKLQAFGVEGMGFSLPINDVRPIVEQLIKSGHINRPWLGISGMPQSTNKKDGTPSDGLLVAAVLDGGPASKAGIMEGDIIKSVNGQSINDINQLKNILMKYKPDDKVTMKIERNGQIKEVKVVLGTAPQNN